MVGGSATRIQARLIKINGKITHFRNKSNELQEKIYRLEKKSRHAKMGSARERELKEKITRIQEKKTPYDQKVVHYQEEKRRLSIKLARLGTGV
jgi:chromosome segregation ATPase